MRSISVPLLRQRPILRRFTPLPKSRLLLFKTSPLQSQIAQIATSFQRPIDPRKVSESKFEKENELSRQQKLKSDHENARSMSTVRPLMGMGPSTQSAHADPDVLAGVKSDLHTVKETFALRDVPKEVYLWGLGGVAPYVVTSATTLALAWDKNRGVEKGLPYLVDPETADSLLHFLEPTQVAYGAVILSFLGAIHWGLEFANYGGSHPARRYTIGILAPALAWPTALLPFDYALLTQFVGFTGMYFADAQATTLGWTPRWYTTYRFILTFVVGTCIVTTLIGRGQIGDSVTAAYHAQHHLQNIRETQRLNQESHSTAVQGEGGALAASEADGEEEARKDAQGDNEEGPNDHSDNSENLDARASASGANPTE